jgi:Type VI secretion system (T6SS), amidase effector protein 4
MRPSFTLLRMGYPKSEKREALFESLGWSDIAQNPAYKDTCAIRMSIALSRAGVSLMGGTMKVQAGRLKGTRIETRQRALSEMLKRLWGEPEVYRTEKDATTAIGKRAGVISFFRIGGGPGGHIDLIYPGPFGFAECARSCYFGCWEIWFWPLK